ncbi:tRNA-2-methylthio-N(6)-dimethylallyladenosine synthase [Amylibacter marinus]|uniref:tRNA-2-methylthio-N(6)-dimethylallyladenosine synthase n=1 Tax=Amylibacter marinus TaxID=1475483 RepID=A0ABQ5VRG3_9RHOB|nr:tRNA (N6-isopentenyl adenosine(37)-C2)-methylthiotransferase MiaB [Amylibacter marinus]GLQ33739.1 tRNA-2-methylthio-N(6)-dimethylallyladenosine synthase [Amylibacter marinus]
MSADKKLFIKTFGCQMNVYDSERMVTALGQDGYSEVSSPEEADMILLNTCHIREKAAEKIYSDLGRFKPLKAKNPDLKIGVAGCVAQAEGGEIMRRQPMVDMVVGPQSYHRLPDMARSVEQGKKPIETDFPEEDKFEHLPRGPKMKRAPAAFLTVQEGCDKFCAFCVVPYTRGAESSRPVAQIIAEARDLVERGVRDITLLGQNVNAYHGTGENGDQTLPQLIDALAEIEDLHRIRFTTSHPNDMDDALINAHRDQPKLMPYLHLPVQAGSDKVLKAMNRKHTAQSYIEIIDRLRAARPDIALSGDFIVGFPGETDADFEQTLDLVRRVKYAQAYSFKYSTRPGTPAADRKTQVPEDVKSERLKRLQDLLSEQQREFMHSMVGRTLPVLLERPGRLEGQLVGRSEYLHGVHLQVDQQKIGQVVNVKIVAADTNSLKGELA